MGLSIQTAPTSEPVTLNDVKQHLRLTTDDEDSILQLYIQSAREWAEDVTHRALITQTWNCTFDRFPIGRGEIYLPKGRCQSITQITYTDDADATITLTGPSAGSPGGTDYQEDLSSDEGGRIAPPHDDDWPSDVRPWTPGGISVRFVAGYGTGTAVPAAIRTAIMFRVADLFRFRGEEDIAEVRGAGTDAAQDLLEDYRIHRWD